MGPYLPTFPIIEVWNELARLLEAELKPLLNLKTVQMGSFASQQSPPGGLNTIVNGIWVYPSPSLINNPVELPRKYEQTFNFRIVFLRKMGKGENPEQETAKAGVLIADMLTSKYTMPDITTIPGNSQILWMAVKTIEFEPQEDNLVASVAADVRAVALQVEVNALIRAR